MPDQKNTSTILMKILKIVVIIILLPIPFLGATEILKKYSPYYDGNSVGIYVLMSILCGIISTLAVYFVANKTLPKQLIYGGALLLSIGICMTSIAGLNERPDFSINMLRHPEREQLRYILLFLNALLYAGAFILIIRYRWSDLANKQKVVVLLFVISIAELIWEFQHHFFLSAHLQDWVNQGLKADDFMMNYTPENVLSFCGLSRCIQYATIAWLALILLQNHNIKKWVFILIVLFTSLGIISGAGVSAFGYSSFEKLNVLMVFFIPGGQFIALYWIGLAMLTKKSSNRPQS